MSTVLISHPACIAHDPGKAHPECPDRLRHIQRALAGEAFSLLRRESAPLGDIDLIKRVHDPAYVDHLHAHIPQSGYYPLDGDTVLSPGSWEAALRAVGGVCHAVTAVMDGPDRNAFVATRPPGHHAEYDQAMGFCLFNNAAIAARFARETYGIKRVAVVDFDVHHGNGTQHLFENDPELFYISTHQWPLYPGTGAPQERGAYRNILNLPLSEGAGTGEIKQAFEDAVIPELTSIRPELLIISAGFDAHADDPLGGLTLTADDYAWITGQLLQFAEHYCENRVVSVLEGGYDMNGLSASVAAHIRRLMAA